MAVFRIESKDNVDIGKKPRVYFTCHPDDFEKYFKKIRDDIFRTHDCVIYYTEDMTEKIAQDDKETDLGRNNLFVVPVTYKLLSTPNRTMDEDVPYAMRAHIPILPVMMESGINEFYSRADKFGELQYLNPYSTDMTEISYEKKLEKYLESVLVSDKTAKRIRAAFDAYIFLSYRKKDRKYANELMRIIHSIPDCRDIAIWFDEFLTPGESFKESIDRILCDSKLFTLLVTPNLLEEPNGKPNFVMGEEYPAARKAGIEILPAEMEKTEKSELFRKFEDLPVCADPHDESFRTRLLETVTALAIETNNTPEHNFLIGLAYLDGIDVEVNRDFALELITSAAEAGISEAMYKLFRMYYDGIGVAVNYKKAAYWAKKQADYLVEMYGEENVSTITALNNLAYTYSEVGEHEKSLELYERVYALSCKVRGEDNADTLGILNNIGTAYSNLENHPKAKEIFGKLYDKSCEMLGEKHPYTMRNLNNLAVTCGKQGKHKTALSLSEKAYNDRCEVLGENHPDTLTSLNNLAVSYSNINNSEKALELFEKLYGLRCEALGKEHPDTYATLHNMADAYSSVGSYQKALELYKDVYDFQYRIRGAGSQYTLITLNNIGNLYINLKEYEKAAEVLDETYQLMCKVLGEEHPETMTTLNNIACNYARIGEFSKAKDSMEKVYTVMNAELGENHPHTLVSLMSLAQFCINMKEYREAVMFLEKAEDVPQDIWDEIGVYPFEAFNNLAFCYGQLGELNKSNDFYRKTYERICEETSESHPLALVVLNNYAASYVHMEDYETALKTYEKAYELSCTVSSQEDMVIAMSGRAFCLKEKGELKEALSFYEKVYEGAVEVWGKDHPNTLKTAGRLDEVKKMLSEK